MPRPRIHGSLAGVVVPDEARRMARVMRMARVKARAAAPTVPEAFGLWLLSIHDEFSWVAPHFLEMQAVLDRVTSGAIRRALFNIPIRHGKSEHNTVRYAVYRLERNPRTRIIVGSYNQQKANKWSRAIRKLARNRGVVMSPERDAAHEWETSAGGGVRAVGRGGGVAGENADVIIIDDPIGSRAEAESQATRDETYEWITHDLMGRCEPHTAVLFTMSRWNMDDPAGRLQEQQPGKWTVVDLPGRAEPDDPLGRAIDAPLWPAERNDAWLDEKLVELGSYGFASLIQGRPTPRGGGLFQFDWWQLLDALPKVWPKKLVRYWDLAGTKQKVQQRKEHDPDWTAGALAGRLLDERTVLVEVTRFRESVAVRDAKMLEVARDDLRRYPNNVTWWIETEAGIQGEERTATLVRKLHALGLAVSTEHPTGSKTSRAEPLQSAAEAGNVLLGPGVWRDAFRLEAAVFPNGSHDDQVDAASGAYAKLSSPTPTISTSRFRR